MACQNPLEMLVLLGGSTLEHKSNNMAEQHLTYSFSMTYRSPIMRPKILRCGRLSTRSVRNKRTKTSNQKKDMCKMEFKHHFFSGGTDNVNECSIYGKWVPPHECYQNTPSYSRFRGLVNSRGPAHVLVRSQTRFKIKPPSRSRAGFATGLWMQSTMPTHLSFQPCPQRDNYSCLKSSVRCKCRTCAAAWYVAHGVYVFFPWEYAMGKKVWQKCVGCFLQRSGCAGRFPEGKRFQ